MPPRNTGRKIAFGFSVASFVSMAVSLVILIYLLATRGASDVITASMFATTLFFLSCGIVLYLMSKPPKYKLLPWDHLDIETHVDEVKEERVPGQANLLKNLWEGNFGLAMTYWVYGVLGGIVWGVGISALVPDPNTDLIKIVWFLFASYYFVVYVGIWQAANKYVGSKVWAILAKFAIIVVVLPLAIQFLKWLGVDQ